VDSETDQVAEEGDDEAVADADAEADADTSEA
jgi:hypothetical protein